MDFCGKYSRPVTPVKDPQSNRSKVSQISKDSENLNPNFTSPDSKLSNSAGIKSAKKAQKSATKNPNPVASPSPRNKIRERKFVVAKKKSKREKSNSSIVECKCNISGKSQKCVCVAYETLRASQEEFFRNRANTDDYPDRDENEFKEEEEGMNPVFQNPEIPDGYEENLEGNDCLEKNGLDETEVKSEGGSTTVKRRRDKLLEEARQSVPEPGSGRVMHLVKAFEKLLSIPKSKESDEKDDKESEDSKKGMKWALPGLQPKAPETQVSSSSFCPSDFFLTSESLGLDSRVCSSLDSTQGSFTVSSRNSGGGQRCRRNSLESSGTFGGRKWKRRQHKVTSQKPFKLRTEQRGRSKEEEFNKKVKEMMMEEEKQRIPVAQGLPWTTDEPERLAKPPVKESTRPVDLVLHSDVRAVERAEFDHQVAEKMSFIEQYRMEMERQQKVEGQTEEVIFDHLHATAFQYTPLGRTILGPAQNIKTITKEDLQNYISTHYTAPRMVIAASGAVKHEDIVEQVKTLFTKLSSESTTTSQLAAKEPAVFTGSEVRIIDDDIPLAQFAVAFNGASWTDPDSTGLMVMQSLLGSWSKNAGGGKHMGSELAQRIGINEIAESMMAFNTNYKDTGLFGVYAIAKPDCLDDLAYSIMYEVTKLCYRVSEDDVIRARNQLKSSLLLHMDGTSPVAEDIGRQLLTYGRRIPFAELFARIDAVDASTVKRVANRFIFDKDIAVAAVGPIQSLPDYNWFRRRTYWNRY